MVHFQTFTSPLLKRVFERKVVLLLLLGVVDVPLVFVLGFQIKAVKVSSKRGRVKPYVKNLS